MNGDEEEILLAIQYMDAIEGEMTPDQIAEAQKLVKEWMEEHGKEQAKMMKRLIPTILVLILLSAPSAEVYARPAECNSIEGAKVMAQDETYLGMIENKYSGDSIFNKYGSQGKYWG